MGICPDSRPGLSQQQHSRALRQQQLSIQLFRLKRLQDLSGIFHWARTGHQSEVALAGLFSGCRSKQVCQCSALPSSQQQASEWLTRLPACRSATAKGAEAGNEPAVRSRATPQSKAYDVIALGNLCVDVVVAMDEVSIIPLL